MRYASFDDARLDGDALVLSLADGRGGVNVQRVEVGALRRNQQGAVVLAAEAALRFKLGVLGIRGEDADWLVTLAAGRLV